MADPLASDNLRREICAMQFSADLALFCIWFVGNHNISTSIASVQFLNDGNFAPRLIFREGLRKAQSGN